MSLWSLPRGNQEQRSDPSYQVRNTSSFSLSKNASRLPLSPKPNKSQIVMSSDRKPFLADVLVLTLARVLRMA